MSLLISHQIDKKLTIIAMISHFNAVRKEVVYDTKKTPQNTGI